MKTRVSLKYVVNDCRICAEHHFKRLMYAQLRPVSSGLSKTLTEFGCR